MEIQTFSRVLTAYTPHVAQCITPLRVSYYTLGV